MLPKVPAWILLIPSADYNLIVAESHQQVEGAIASRESDGLELRESSSNVVESALPKLVLPKPFTFVDLNIKSFR